MTITLAPASAERLASGSTPYPENAAAMMAPMRATASIVTTASGTTGRCIVTTSPRPTPRRRSPAAARRIWVASSGNDSVRMSPPLDSQMIAG